MSHRRVGVVLVAGMIFTSCQTITEEMPIATLSPVSAPAPIVFQVPVFIPGTPTPPPTPVPGGTGGGGTSGPVQPLPTSQPLPTAKPTNPPANNDPAPPPSNGGGGCSGWPNNCNPVASIHAYVYYIVCNGEAQPDTKFAESGPAGCDVRLDATPKDEKGKHTQAKGQPSWTIHGGSSWEANKNPYTPLVRGGHSGELTAWVEIDGVRSNTFSYRFQ
jgi:hypothetical protein